MTDKTYLPLSRSRAATQQALAEIYSGADLQDADAFLDHLEDLGYRVVPREMGPD